MSRRHRPAVTDILRTLREATPRPKVELDYADPYQLLVATILSAQCTDRRVNLVTPDLFRRYPQARDLADADISELESMIRSTGFFRSKAKNLVACATTLVQRFHGRVPSSMDDLVTLPGVGRKTANVILGHAYGLPALVVDTHVKRVAQRLALSKSANPDQIEQDLMRSIPRSQWTEGSQRLLLHGRYVCLARRPTCSACVVYDLCPWKGKSPR
ncbi:MAG: endonuclease III [Nitrospiraceae bacterium]